MRCNICWTSTKNLAKYYILKCKHVYCDKVCLKKLLTKKQCLLCNFGKYEDIKENIVVVDNAKDNPMDFIKYSMDNLGPKLSNCFKFIEFQHNEEINILKNYSKKKTSALENKVEQLKHHLNTLSQENKQKDNKIHKLEIENSHLKNNSNVLQNELKESNRKIINYQKYISKKRENSKNSNYINISNSKERVRIQEQPKKVKAIKYTQIENDNNSEISNLLQTFGKKPSFSKTISLEKASTFKDSKRSKVSLKEVLFDKKIGQKESLFSCYDSKFMGSLFQKI